MAKQTDSMTIPELAFALTQHADDLQMFANGVSMDAYGDFEQTEDAIMELIYQLYQKYADGNFEMEKETSEYLEKLKDKISEIRENCFDEEEDELISQSREVVKNESKFIKAFFIALTGKMMAGISSEWYTKISKYGIYNGGTIGQIFKKLSSGDVTRIYEAMINSLRNGTDLAGAREAVRSEMKKSARFVKSEIDSIINGVANDVAMAFAAENSIMLLYSTALDDKVCDECSRFQGRFFDADSPDIPALPRHINCRCRYIPVPDDSSEYKKLDLPFSDYFAGLSEEEKEKRIGKEKYELALTGEYELDDYESPMPEQRVSMEELKERDKKIFLAATARKKESETNA